MKKVLDICAMEEVIFFIYISVKKYVLRVDFSIFGNLHGYYRFKTLKILNYSQISDIVRGLVQGRKYIVKEIIALLKDA